MELSVVVLALSANLCFALGSQFFAHYSRTIGSMWMNWAKASIALICFTIYCLFFVDHVTLSMKNYSLLLISGFVALGGGDIFLLKAFSDLGPGRTLMIFGFQPLILSTAGYYLFNQTIDTSKFWAIAFFIICLFIFSLEKFKQERSWNLKGSLFALLGMGLDAFGIIITRSVFDSNPSFSPMEGNAIRCVGAIFLFVIITKFFKPLNLIQKFKDLSKRDKGFVILGSLLGTFLSLTFYLNALKLAHLGSLSGIAITGTIFASIFECFYHKKFPSRYLIGAFISFMLGMKFLLF
ncbi:MAG: DMT family transporter [Oligoflexia bacterium]|nr:DMT family transporter [Oligoflexia bacterium]